MESQQSRARWGIWCMPKPGNEDHRGESWFCHVGETPVSFACRQDAEECTGTLFTEYWTYEARPLPEGVSDVSDGGRTEAERPKDSFRHRIKTRDAEVRASVQDVIDVLRALSNGPSQLGDLADQLQASVEKLER